MKCTVNMEQHPVPQNITGFQFKLIGDMTIRQFLYLAGGILFGYILLQFKLPGAVKWFLAISSGGAGFAFAFVPIEERPLDRWFVSFFKSIYSPTQFLWKKRAVPPEILTAEVSVTPPPAPETLKKEETTAKIEEYLMTLPTAPIGELDQKEASFLAQILSFFGVGEEPQVAAAQPLPSEVTGLLPEKPEPPAVAPPPQKPPVFVKPSAGKEAKPAEEFEKRTEELTNKITALQQELATQTITQERFLEVQAQLSQLLSEKERLTKELVELKKMLAEKPQIPVRPTAMAQAPGEPTVKIVMPAVAPKIGMPRPPTIANTPSGIIKTQKGAILPGIIVEIRNQEGTPVRALKSGKLGQFAVSTPLANGTYTIHLEDPQRTFYFDIIEVTLNGGIVSPLEIFAKTQKDKIKEELRKKLFSQDNF
ncbi:MAG: Uncharacterized protein LiPW16_256 [Microgenomates group bacterium LiPW_16]|nr:MAG: Uncharacterized protein LiPW16_256 [Microgenomates group bacterium LiPW_16]